MGENFLEGDEVMPTKTSVSMRYKNQDLTLFYIGEICSATGRTSQTIRKWELSGTIPKTPFRDRMGRRLYLREHVDAMVECIERYKIGQGKDITKTYFKQAIYKRFNEVSKKYGIGVKTDDNKEKV